MRSRYRVSWQVTLIAGILLCSAVSGTASDFLFGAWNDGHNAQSGEWRFDDSLYAAAGFNFYVGAVADSGIPIYGIDAFADRGWRVFLGGHSKPASCGHLKSGQ